MDFSGIVENAGEGVTDFRRGDEVYGQASILSGGSGAFAEMAMASTETIALRPKSQSHQDFSLYRF